MTAAIYVHLPFCVQKCAYCDFVSYPGMLDKRDEYINAVLDEARAQNQKYSGISAKSVYLGGGTPSLLEPDQINRLIGGLIDIFPPEKDAEITMEANPGTLSREKLLAARSAGVNRLSIGAQAAQERLLKLLGRIHTFEEAQAAVALARDVGFNNISCDLMAALPSQTKEELEESISLTAATGAQHISCYSLILEPATRLYRQVNSGEISEPDEDAACEMLLNANHVLDKLGYKRYEISNFAKPGFESRHNLVYWEGGDYLGLGCAAHSFMNGERFENPAFKSYMEGQRQLSRHYVDTFERMEETLLLKTRMTSGFSLEDFQNSFGKKAYAALINEACKSEYAQLISIDNVFLRFTERGLLVHSALVLRLVEAVEEKY